MHEADFAEHPENIPNDEDEIADSVPVGANRTTSVREGEDEDPEDFMNSLFGGNIDPNIFDDIPRQDIPGPQVPEMETPASPTVANEPNDNPQNFENFGMSSSPASDIFRYSGSIDMSGNPPFTTPVTNDTLNLSEARDFIQQLSRSPSVSIIEERCVPSSSQAMDFILESQSAPHVPLKRNVSFMDVDTIIEEDSQTEITVKYTYICLQTK